MKRYPLLLIALWFLGVAAHARPFLGVNVLPYDPNFDPYLGLNYRLPYGIENHAGRSSEGYVDGIGRQAMLRSFIQGLWMDPDGSILFSDSREDVIRKILPNGKVEHYAGVASGNSLKDGSLDEARFALPKALVRDSQGDLYVADSRNGCIRKITKSGVVSTLVGNLSLPDGFAIDSDDNLYVVEGTGHAILKIKTRGTPGETTVYAGNRNSSGSVDGDSLTARFNRPCGLAFDTSGNLYVLDKGNYLIRKIGTDGKVSTLAGTGTFGENDGTGSKAAFNDLWAICYHTSGVLVVGDKSRIRTVTTTGVVDTLVGRTTRFAKGAWVRDGTGPYASFMLVTNIVNAPDGGLIVSDEGMIRKVSMDGKVTTLAGDNSSGYLEGYGDTAKFFNPTSIVSDGKGSLYVSSWSTGSIHKIDSDRNVVSVPITVGNTTQFYDGMTFDAKSGSLYVANQFGEVIRISADGKQELLFKITGMLSCCGLAFNSKKELYVLDTDNHLIWKWTAATGAVIAAGKSGQKGADDGAVGSSTLNYPEGLAIDESDNVFIADIGNCLIRRLDANGQLTTYAGVKGQSGCLDGDRSTAQFSNPSGIAIDKKGYLYVADSGNSLVRRITPSGQVDTIAGTRYSDVFAPGIGRGSSCGESTGLCVAADGSIFLTTSNAVLRLQPSNKVYPESLSLKLASTAVFSVTPSTSSAKLQWYKDGNSIAGQTSTELVLDQAAYADAGSYSVSIDGTMSEAAVLAVVHPPIISSQLTAQNLFSGDKLTLSAAASGDGVLSYQWYKDGNAIAGATDASLILSSVAKSDAGSYYVVVRNEGGSVQSNSVPVAIQIRSHMTALSVRTVSGVGDNILFVGLAISGVADGQTKQIVARGVGPGLQSRDVSAFMTDPSVWVYSGSNVIASNDNWDLVLKPALASVGLDNLQTGSKDAAVLALLGNGGFPIKIGSKGSESGVVLAEIYETDKTSASKMTALSVRAAAGTGDQTLIAGFVIEGMQNMRLVIRGLGPALASSIGSGYLVDPQIQVYSGQTVIVSNDNWSSTPETLTAFASVGLTPMAVGSKDAALIVDLPPGTYTVFLTGVNNTTGIGLIEIYELP